MKVKTNLTLHFVTLIVLLSAEETQFCKERAEMKTKITCFMCRCLISVIDGDKFRFNDHMKNEHDVRHDFDSLLVLSVMTTTEKKVFTKEFDRKLNDRITCKPKDNIITPVQKSSN